MIKQINVLELDQRFYVKDGEYAPSVTYMLSSAYPSGYALSQWRGDVGNKRADEIMDEAAEDGTYVHNAIESILKGETVHTEHILNNFRQPRALKILKCLKSFMEWHDTYQPKVISTEYVVFDSKLKLAGTIDCKCKLNIDDYKATYVIDWKTSKSIHTQHKVQLSLYQHMDGAKQSAIVHLGNTTKAGYSFLPIKQDDQKKFLSQGKQANKLFQELYPNSKPSTGVFPEVFKI